MQRLNTMRHTPLQPQRGVTLIESLVALVVIALGAVENQAQRLGGL